MLWYHLTHAFASLRRNPVYSFIMMSCLALGVGLWSAATTSIASHKRPPLAKQSGLYHVEIDHATALDPRYITGREFWGFELPAKALPFRDALALAKSPLPDRTVATFGSTMFGWFGASREKGLVDTRVRFCSAGFFSMFELSIRAGHVWHESKEAEAGHVAVIEAQASRRFFGDEHPVGKTIELGGLPFSIVGVVEIPQGVPRTYDFWSEAGPEVLFLPIEDFAELGSRPQFAYPVGDRPTSFEAALASDDRFVHLWAQFSSTERKDAFLQFANDHATRQQAEGRHLGPIALRPFESWRTRISHLHPGYELFAFLALIALVASCLNLVRLLIAKFQSHAHEVSIRRALGASRRRIFVQHLTEAWMIGVGGAILGLGFAQLALLFFNETLPYRPVRFVLDPKQVLIAVGAALLSGLVAGIYPAWRICTLAPAAYLRRM